MRLSTLITTAVAAAALSVSLAACSTPSGSAAPAAPATSSSAAAPSGTSSSTATSTAALSGTFAGLNDKKVSGTVSVADGKIVLAGFSSDEGPDLHVYLTGGTDEAAVAAGVEIDAVSFDTASQTFALGGGVDASSYTDVVIHCDKAKAVFGAAALS
ncbi:DM13 domain-containing protein [Rathayibacter sp. VKM Ac-2760]|uniref:DM13 domain-containing protein n=1 Tax=Rathayibacter sp. VKM Ac-2760 TaxID=2609253 RepID=UPI0013177D13|nr:DM13 domain-containing protein [Rathayibacter sp. VKM Ac-2760]QHC59569.1 hypothetical protein GSU72_14155 [Rathayibacter sp. VKM Ac-2760]